MTQNTDGDTRDELDDILIKVQGVTPSIDSANARAITSNIPQKAGEAMTVHPTSPSKDELRKAIVWELNTHHTVPKGTDIGEFEANRIMPLIDRYAEQRVREALVQLKQYNGAYIGIDGRRVEKMVSHTVIDEMLGTLNNTEGK